MINLTKKPLYRIQVTNAVGTNAVDTGHESGSLESASIAARFMACNDALWVAPASPKARLARLRVVDENDVVILREIA